MSFPFIIKHCDSFSQIFISLIQNSIVGVVMTVLADVETVVVIDAVVLTVKTTVGISHRIPIKSKICRKFST